MFLSISLLMAARSCKWAVRLCSAQAAGVDAAASGACGRPNLCGLPADSGPCFGAFPHFYFDAAEGQCRAFVYGGCEGNANNFETLEACVAACG